MNGNILIIDDEEQLRKLLSRIISLEGFNVLQAPTLKAGTELLRRGQVDVVLCDVRLPDGDGVAYVATIRKEFPATQVILLTAFGNIPDGVQAIKNGAFDYITKGDDNDRIIPLLHQAMERAITVRVEAVQISEISTGDFSDIIGSSPPVTAAIALARRIAPGETTVLLLGETGTGKEVFANAIHRNSTRARHPLVAINCSAFGRELLEAELFGYKAGAYTGAQKDKQGLIEIADKGTLFLDEIGEMQLELQAKLLRVLGNGEFIKLGDTKVSKVNVRIVAATNRDLRTDVSKGVFREDLFYRLNVFPIELPALRNRAADIPELVRYFIKSLAAGAIAPALNDDAMNLLQRYPWPGNIRELRNVLQRAMILMNGTEITPADLPFEIQHLAGGTATGQSLADVERRHISAMLAHSNGNKTRTAKLLGIGLATLYRKMDEYRLRD